MKFIGDFHIHSKYSRATSKDMNLEELDKWAKIKGIKVISAGDFTHPIWFKELETKLEPAEEGLYRLKKTSFETRFILTTEISCVYSKKGKVRKIHVLIFSPSLDVVRKINTQLGLRGNLKADGRPILGLDVKDLAAVVLEASDQCFIVPAHAWTPWFSIFGSKSGFDSIEECFEDYSKFIFAIETGLSSDPAMNWRLSALDRVTLISNSDSHSAKKIGREANVFNTNLSYFSIVNAIKNKNNKEFLYTIEFFPEEGKYHYDGHRLCGISMSPKESKKHNNICPVCGKSLVIGVLNRVDELADRPDGFVPQNHIPYKSLVPLEEIIADALGVLPASKQVMLYYKKLIDVFGSEFNILLDEKIEEIKQVSTPKIGEGIKRVREGKVKIVPGYDGVYGKIKIFDDKEEDAPQKTLF
jgi:uncharacterized protein (TIGR00375 family)